MRAKFVQGRGHLAVRNQAQDGGADHLVRAVAEEPLRALVPTGHEAVQSAADNGVARRFDDGGELRADLFGSSAIALARLDRLGHIIEGAGEAADFIAPPAHAGARGQIALAELCAGVRERADGPQDQHLAAPPSGRQNQHGDQPHKK